MKLGMKILCVAVVIAGMLAFFRGDNRPFMSAKSAEAGEMQISSVNPSEGYTVNVISAETSTVMSRFGEVIVGIIILVLLFSGVGIPLLIIGAIIWALAKYIVTGGPN